MYVTVHPPTPSHRSGRWASLAIDPSAREPPTRRQPLHSSRRKSNPVGPVVVSLSPTRAPIYPTTQHGLLCLEVVRRKQQIFDCSRGTLGTSGIGGLRSGGLGWQRSKTRRCCVVLYCRMRTNTVSMGATDRTGEKQSEKKKEKIHPGQNIPCRANHHQAPIPAYDLQRATVDVRVKKHTRTPEGIPPEDRSFGRRSPVLGSVSFDHRPRGVPACVECCRHSTTSESPLSTCCLKRHLARTRGHRSHCSPVALFATTQ